VSPAAVDVVIAVHTTSRPIRKAVESVLRAGEATAAIVVAHEVPAEEIESLLDGLLDEGRVRVVGFSDGVRSPAGPFNHGLGLTSAEFVTILGSDDQFEPRALDAALARARADGADAVILPIRLPGVIRVRNPLTRRGHTRNLDPVKDRLYGRTAPLALMRRTLIGELSPVFDPAFPTGEDLAFGARLWSSASVSYGHLDPAYFGGLDAGDRVTEGGVDLMRGLGAARALADQPWLAALDARARAALATKIIRVSVLGGLTARTGDTSPMTGDEISILVDTRKKWLSLAPSAERVLPRADRSVLDECRAGVADGALRTAVARRAAAGLVARNITRNPFLAYGGDSVLRRYTIYRRLRREEKSLR
jgi:hypothetical protein